ncbi:MAG: Mov34/MPN/PAD-1 family protein [Anaerolineales bacterium]|nr:Mov34/MPN/PAD-1 family protein [Anaerolineales bacterium]
MMAPDDFELASCVLATGPELPPIRGFVQYVVGAGGLYVRAADGRIEALVPVAPSLRPLSGLAMVEPYARLAVPRVPQAWLDSILASARKAMPSEAMYQLVADPLARNSYGGWACARPAQLASPGAVTFLDLAGASVDLHSHNSMPAFFSATDDADEQGLRFYVVIGRLDTRQPQIAARVGVYGHTMPVRATAIFDGLGCFVDTFGRCRQCGRRVGDGAAWWTEYDLCERCDEAEAEVNA